MEEKTKINLIITTVISVVVIMVLLLLNPFKIINSGYKGLVFKWGAIQNEVLDAGFHLKMPLKTKIVEIPVRPLELETEIGVEEDGAITKDNQTVGTSIIVFYKYNENDLVNMWQVYGTERLENIIKTGTYENFKIVIGKHNIFTIAENQGDIKKALTDAIKNSVTNYPVEIVDVKVSNFNWSDQFDRQIEITMEKAQQVRQAEQELLISQQQAQKQVKEAEAKKEALIMIAEAEKEVASLNADAKALEGEGLKKYNESIRATADIELRLRELEIEKMRIENWDGHYVSQNNYSPIPISQGGILGN